MESEYVNFVIVPLTTLALYQLDLHLKYNTTNYTYTSWPNNTIFKYQITYFLVGLIFYSGYHFGFKIFSKDPIEIIKNYSTNKTPLFFLIMGEGAIIGWLARSISSSKAIPGYHGTIDGFLEKIVFKDLEQDLLTDQRSGKSKWAYKLIDLYKRKNRIELNLKILGNKLITYHEENNLVNPEVQSLIKDVSEVQSLHKGLMFILNKYSLKKVKAILFDAE